MSDIADSDRRIALERADAAREAVRQTFGACIQALESYHVQGEMYRRAFKRAIRVLKEAKEKHL